MKELNLDEFNRLEELLKEAGIPYEREDCEDVPREFVLAHKLPHFYDHHEIYYPDADKHYSDAVISYGSYGREKGLLEQRGLLPPCGDSVQGYLSADAVFERWKEDHERRQIE